MCRRVGHVSKGSEWLALEVEGSSVRTKVGHVSNGSEWPACSSRSIQLYGLRMLYIIYIYTYGFYLFLCYTYESARGREVRSKMLVLCSQWSKGTGTGIHAVLSGRLGG